MTTSESKGRFFTKRIDSHIESNKIDSNRELECSRLSIARQAQLICFLKLQSAFCGNLKP